MKPSRVANGYYCEECEQIIWPATTRGELRWLRDREPMVREVAAHIQGGLDTWMDEALAFLGEHAGHSIIVREKP